MLYRALLFEDHAGQVQQHLVAFHLQLRFLVEVRVAETDAAELEVAGEDFFVELGEGLVAYLVNHLE